MDKILDLQPLTMDKSGIEKGAMNGEVAVVTGGASNIGLGIARCLAWAGCKVIICDISAEAGCAAEEAINSETAPGTAMFVMTDVTREHDIKSMAEKAYRAFGKVDILVNNAMNMKLNNTIMRSTIRELDESYAISARGVMLAVKEFVPGMLRRRHGVVTYSATAFNHPMGPSIYSAGKAAATSLMMSLANELGPAEQSGIGVFTFIPAGVGRFDPSKFKDMPKRQPGDAMADMPLAMPGYPGFIPPEDGGAAMVYSILHAQELHGSGIIIQQALKAMNWEFPKPETVSRVEMDRLSDAALPMIFSLVGPGLKNLKDPIIPVGRSAQPET
ncbi:NAD(P)-dependent dehydrogenase, short-chain alcohol dehydrogenase family [Sporobacter termitidis DSM 10068]|uniref:NAD(P)-dependent dehydrogenase, short-chain alcohol dehydrogenase family n=1 Tax=Sporobacter termitidis DSM 10068 TaxID=1123282 RepID=A0A1M5XDR5_9FIRM|nr:SDR family oxidoreductase [Sporobacter termitidis]SHH98015.1 NAD(P)-dependent dehydrogenase, short-chain alcohol dehydrogenase family [Sporobacter termitidis DSM 10068]